MALYSEDPTAQADIYVSAPRAVVWALVSDITLPARFSTELTGAWWIDGAAGPCPGARFNEAFARQGFGEEVRTVQRLWREGRRDEAARLVPLAIGQKTNLLGTAAMVRERVRLYRGAGIGTLAVKLSGPLQTRLDTLAQLMELVDEVNREEPAKLVPLRVAARDL